MALTQVQGQMLSGSSNTTTTIQSNGTTAITINSSQNVGIGTASPAQKLHVAGSIQAGTASTTSGSVYLFNSSNDTRCDVTNTGTEFKLAATYLTTGGYKPITFYTTDAERVRITPAGDLLVGKTTIDVSVKGFSVAKSGDGTLGTYIENNQGQNGTSCIYLNHSYGSGTQVATQYRFNGTTVGQVNITSSATSYATSSDYRLKESVAPMVGALDKVSALKPCTYKWKADGSNGQGFIAHELAEVCPEAVSGEKDAVNEDGTIKAQGIDTSFLVATLTAAIQELNAKVDAQAAEIAVLKAK